MSEIDAETVDAGVGARMAAEGALCLVLPERAYFLIPRADAMQGVRDLDSSRLDTALAGLPAHELTFQHGVHHIVNRVRRREAQAGVLLRPVRVAADQRDRGGRRAHAPEVDLLPPEAEHGRSLPLVRLIVSLRYRPSTTDDRRGPPGAPCGQW